MIDFFLKNRFTLKKSVHKLCLKNRFNITIKMVHATCRNIKALMRMIRFLYIYMISRSRDDYTTWKNIPISYW